MCSHQRTAKGASEKGPRQKTSKIVKKCQKYFRHFSTFFAQVKNRQKSSKSVKNMFDIFWQFSRGTSFPAPFRGLWSQPWKFGEFLWFLGRIGRIWLKSAWNQLVLAWNHRNLASVWTISWLLLLAPFHTRASGKGHPNCTSVSDGFFFNHPHRKFLWVRRGCQASQRRGWPPEKSGELPGKSGELPGKSGKLPGNLWLLLSSTVRELPGKSPKNFRGSSGNFRGSPGTFQKLGGAWLPPSDSPNISESRVAVLGCRRHD